jgi:uncharacterized protein
MSEGKKAFAAAAAPGQVQGRRPEPVPTPETAPFWQGTLEGKLMVQKCNSCARTYFYPRTFCRWCFSQDVEWITCSGRARLASFVINMRPVPPFDPALPQVIALVDLEEGVRMMTNIVGVDPEPANFTIGMELMVEFEATGAQAVPVFRPVSAA